MGKWKVAEKLSGVLSDFMGMQPASDPEWAELADSSQTREMISTAKALALLFALLLDLPAQGCSISTKHNSELPSKQADSKRDRWMTGWN